MVDVAPSVDDAPDDDNGDESELDWARAVTTHSASAPAPPCPSGTPALADAVARDIHDPDHIAEILCVGADEVLEVQDLLEDEQDVIAKRAQTEAPSTFELHKHGAYVGREGNAARAAEYCRLLPFSRTSETLWKCAADVGATS